MRRFLSAAFLILLSVVLTACGQGKPANFETSGAEPKSSGTEQTSAKAPSERVVKGDVTVYSSASQEVLDMLTAGLKAKYPDLNVHFVYGGTEELVDKLSGEFAAGNVQADAIMVGDPAYAEVLKNQGLLLPYVPAGADQVRFNKDPEGHYTAVRFIDVVLAYNTNLVKPEEAPKSFKELLDPKWKGQVSFSDPTKSGTSFVTVGALVQKYGWEYFEQAKANEWQIGGGSSAPNEALASGKAKIGIVVEYKYLSDKANGAPVQVIWPEEGPVIMESPWAILKAAKNPEGAKAVADYMFTLEAQTILTKANMHPVISGITPPEGSRPASELADIAFKIDWAKLAQEKGDIQDQFVQVVALKP